MGVVARLLGLGLTPRSLRSLFSPPTTDDARHDEALSSRIAALNLLELSLDHLGIQTRESASEGNTQADIEKRNETVMAGLGRIVEAVGKGAKQQGHQPYVVAY